VHPSAPKMSKPHRATAGTSPCTAWHTVACCAWQGFATHVAWAMEYTATGCVHAASAYEYVTLNVWACKFE
jgi:hypothetical protein